VSSVQSELRWFLTQVGSPDDGGAGVGEGSSMTVGDGGAVGQGRSADDGGGGVSMGGVGDGGTGVGNGGSSVGQRGGVSQGGDNSSGGDGQNGEEGDLKSIHKIIQIAKYKILQFSFGLFLLQQIYFA